MKPADSAQFSGAPVSIERREQGVTAGTVHDNPLVSRVLSARGITSSRELEFALADLPQPEGLLGLDAALDRMVEAITQQQQILIVGDYDCDGATSTTLAVEALTAMGASRVGYRVPNRLQFGYGLSPGVVDDISATGNPPDLIITVDNGVASVEGVERAKQFGIDVVVTDHHLPPVKLPEAVAIVNPNIPGATFPGKNLAGVGVIFFVMIALRARLKASDWFTAAELPVPVLANMLDLVAIGTIADVVELDSVNRTLVEQGLRRIRAGHTRPGVRALCEVAGVRLDKISSTNIGFGLGPRLNAAGRISDIDIGINCLLAESGPEALDKARQLDALNSERRSIESEIRAEAENHVVSIIENFPDDWAQPQVLCLYDNQWHEGVIGIVAGRLKEQLHRPVIVFGGAEDGMIKGSGRSIPQLHLRDVLQEVSNRLPNGVLKKFGGHAMAAGLTLKEQDFAEFTLHCDAVVRQKLGDQPPGKVLLSDGPLVQADYTVDTARLLANVVPWGQGFAEPVFEGEFLVNSVRVLKEKHLKLVVKPVDSTMSVDAIAFNQVRGQDAGIETGDTIRMLFRLAENEFRGSSSLQLMIVHLQQG